MEGFNWWGAFMFIMPIVLIIAFILDVVDKLIKRVRR